MKRVKRLEMEGLESGIPTTLSCVLDRDMSARVMDSISMVKKEKGRLVQIGKDLRSFFFCVEFLTMPAVFKLMMVMFWRMTVRYFFFGKL